MSSLDDVIKELSKKGIDVATIGKSGAKNVDKFPTGLLSLDYILGGGYPRGRVIELFGMESSGKTCLSLLAIAAVQRGGGKACLVDIEHAFDPVWSAKMGVDVESLIHTQPDSGEQALLAVDKIASTGEVDLIVVDSTAALIPKKEVDGEIGDQHVGLQARMMSQALRKLCPAADKSGTTIIFINQIRLKVGIMFGNPETTPGGMALKFYSSLRLRISKKERLRKAEGKPIYGHKIKVVVSKSKVSQPYLNSTFTLDFVKGIDTIADKVDAAITSKVLTKRGNTFLFNKESLCVGYNKLIETLNAHPDIMDSIDKQVAKRIEDLRGTVIGSVESVDSSKVVVDEEPKKKSK